jgi:hypothetical protein
MKNSSLGFFITEEFFSAVIFLRLASISSSRWLVFFIIRNGLMQSKVKETLPAL